jgi:hypothetical protein
VGLNVDTGRQTSAETIEVSVYAADTPLRLLAGISVTQDSGKRATAGEEAAATSSMKILRVTAMALGPADWTGFKK